MNPLRALVLGLVQGVTEFVPVSSSGHLVLLPALLHWQPPPVAFDVLLHAATVVSLLVYFRADILPLFGIGRSPGESGASPRTLLWIVAATVVTGALAFPVKDRIEALFASPRAAAGFLLVTAVVLLASEAAARGQRNLGGVGWRQGLAVGVAQALAACPGLSRSGMTICAGLVTGLSRKAAAQFAFLVSIPAILGASAVKLPELFSGSWTVPLTSCIVGFASAAISGYVAIWLVMGFVQQRRLKWFAAYCIIAGALALLFLR